VLRGISLLDRRTGTHAALTMPADGQFRRVHSGDVKIYQNLLAAPRAYVVGQATVAPDDAAALAALDDPSFQPVLQVVLQADDLAAAGLAEKAAQLVGQAVDATVEVISSQPERIALAVTLDAPGALVLSDTWYPGWEATVDGEPAVLLRANYLFRALLLPAGEHRVLFEYRPASLGRGAVISLAATLALVIIAVAGVWSSRAPGRRPSR
jgi:hypothetical protein